MIDTKALREKILELAMQGKLTEQLESDETAEELYQQIKDEKERLIKNGEIKKGKSLTPVSDIKLPFSLPKGWKLLRLGDIISLQSGQDLKPHEYNDQRNGIPYITGASNYNDDGTLIINRWTETPKSFAVSGDILISCKGTVGKITILKHSKVHIARQIMGIRTYCVNNRFIEMFMQSVVNRIRNAQKGLIPGIERNDILNLAFCLPTLSEQNRIVEKVESISKLLDTIDEAQAKYSSDSEILKSKLISIGIQGKLIEQLESDGTAEELYQQIQDEKKNLMKEGKIKKEKTLPSIADEEIPFEIPSSWKWCRLGDCIRLQSGQDFKPSEYNADNIGTPYLTGASNIDTSGELIINRWTEKPTCIAEKNDVLIVCKGSGYGKIAICTIDYAHIARQFMAVKYSEFIDTKYMKLFLVSNFTVIKENGQGLIPGIDRPSVLNLPFPLPTLAEQKRIVDTLSKLQEVIDSTI